ncbi:MAG: hypothetical protein JWP35_3276 [Caulobacter sp.]|nr:hypothetical protein [Caulobacter sp.]
MPTPSIATGPDQIDADWMTAALRASGALPQGRVSGMTVTPVGNGLLGDSFRFALTYDAAPDGAPASVVGKFPAVDPTSKASGAALGLYVREVSFYRELAHTVGIITPKPHVAAIDLETHDFTLIFEDFGPARPGDQLAGCSVEDAETAVLEAAALHAPHWGKDSLGDIAWLNSGEATMTTVSAMLPAVIVGFKDRYDGQIEPELLGLMDRLPAVMSAMRADRTSPRTVTHGDFRLDNVLFDIQGGTRRMGTLDWQTPAVGPGINDVAYFLSAGLSPQERREHERALVARYHGELTRLGVNGYGLDQCWTDYRRFSVSGLFTGLFSAMVVERTERGDALFLKMVRGGGLQALEHKTFDFWDA